MKVVAETDTGIPQTYLVSPEWDLENDLFIVRCDRKYLPIILMNLKEWVRQIEEELEPPIVLEG